MRNFEPQDFTVEQLKAMLARQEVTNVAYTTSNWRRMVPIGKVMCAAQDEFSEFLREIKPEWKWWDAAATANREQALFELIDITHFMLTCILHRCPPDILDTMAHMWGKDDIGAYARPADVMQRMNFYLCDFMRDIHIDRVGYAIRNFRLFHREALHLINYTADDAFKAYEMKNDRNMERVSKGVMRGVDVKASEVELTLSEAQ